MANPHFRIKEQARFTRPKYLPEDLKGLVVPERRTKWYEITLAMLIGAVVAGGCLWLLACWHILP